jgi:hypothetical protein
MVSATGSLALTPPGGPTSMFLSIDGGHSVARVELKFESKDSLLVRVWHSVEPIP